MSFVKFSAYAPQVLDELRVGVDADMVVRVQESSTANGIVTLIYQLYSDTPVVVKEGMDFVIAVVENARRPK